MINILEPFERMIRQICDAIYPTLSLINPYMYLLKNSFASREEIGESFDTYLELIYGSISNEEEDDDIVSDDEYISSGGSRQHWQYAHRHFHQRMVNKKNKSGQAYRQISKRKNRNSTFNSNEISLDDINTVEYLPPVDTSNLLQKVCAAIFFIFG